MRTRLFAATLQAKTDAVRPVCGDGHQYVGKGAGYSVLRVPYLNAGLQKTDKVFPPVTNLPT